MLSFLGTMDVGIMDRILLHLQSGCHGTRLPHSLGAAFLPILCPEL